MLVRPVALSDAAQFGQEILAIMNETTPDLERSKRRKDRLNWWAVRLFYATMFAFGLGIVVLVWRITTC